MTLLKYSLILSLVLVTGCSSVVQSYGNYVDAQDPCQMKGKESGYTKPEFCKYGRGYTPAVRLYTPQGQLIGIAR